MTRKIFAALMMALSALAMMLIPNDIGFRCGLAGLLFHGFMFLENKS